MVDIAIDLEEEEDRFFLKAEFDEKIALSLYRDRYLYVDFPSPKNGERYVLRSKGYIGQIPTSEGILIRIRPKVPIHNLFRMLEYAYNLASFQFLDGKITVDSLDDLFENLASILAKRVLDRTRKGLYCCYVKEEDSLSYLRGQIKVIPSIRAFMRGSVRLECEYEEHTPDVEDNHILVWTLLQLPRFPLKRNEVRRQVRQAYRALTRTIDVKQVEPCACINRFYHRLNDDYRPMHGLCRFFLEHTGPSVEVGEHEFIPFVLNMPNLFESFVAKWLQIHLPEDLRIETQYNAKLGGESGIVFRIDLVLIDVASNEVIAVLDTKYKRKECPEKADIHQIVAYAEYMHTKNAFLIYPSPLQPPLDTKVGEINVRSIIFNIADDPDEAGRSFIEKLMDLLKC